MTKPTMVNDEYLSCENLKEIGQKSTLTPGKFRHMLQNSQNATASVDIMS